MVSASPMRKCPEERQDKSLGSFDKLVKGREFKMDSICTVRVCISSIINKHVSAILFKYDLKAFTKLLEFFQNLELLEGS